MNIFHSLPSKLGIRLVVLVLAMCGSLLTAQNFEQIALEHLQGQAESYGLAPDDVSDMVVTDHYASRHNGVTHLYLRQTYQGIGIFQANVNINLMPSGKVINMGVACQANIARRIDRTTPSLSPQDAILAVATVYNLGSPIGVTPKETAQGRDLTQLYAGGNISQQDIPMRLMYVAVPGEKKLRLCWDLSILPNDNAHWWSVRLDAQTGEILSVIDWTNTCEFGHEEGEHFHDHGPLAEAEEHMELFAAPTPPAPMPPANTYTVFPDPIESPSHGVRSAVTNPWNLTASPFGWHDTNGAAGAESTETRGNNVNAQEDQNGNNGAGNAPDGGPTLEFNFPLNLNAAPATYEDAALTNLFFWNNRIHDVLYIYGFDEVSGNFQENNYGNGGAAGDRVNADGQDGSGLNNANFSTPPDGNNPRMQMFLWAANASTFFNVNAPGSIAGSYTAVEAGFGPGLTTTALTGNLVLVDDGSANPTEGCNALTNGAAVNGNIALIDRGNCQFVQKVINAQNEGAVACVVCNNQAGAPFAMGGANGAITIPSVMISQADCATIRAQLGAGVNVSLSNTGGAFQKDGDFDNGIIAHEYGHGVSNRLVGGPSNTSCLGNDEQMGEGWSDWLGLIMTIEPGDAGGNSRGIGTYAISQPTSGGGIRPAPYSTNMAINPFTYGDIQNTGAISRPHGVGFLWCNMIWDMSWDLIDLYGFDPDLDAGTGGNNIAMQLVMDGMKLLNCNPGMQDGRDAILQADTVLYNGIHGCLIWQAFARRGMGFSASQGNPNSRTDGVEAFDLPPFCNTLPVEWLYLSAEPGVQDIALSWAVAMEEQNQGFEIQRRPQFEETFTKVGYLDSKGSGASEYGFLDRNVHAGIRYEYRIKQIDYNGVSSYSNAVEAMITPNDQLTMSLVPNPAGSTVALQLDGQLENGAQVEVYNLVGKVMLERSMGEDEARVGINLNLTTLPAGHYLVKVNANGTTLTQRLMVSPTMR